MQLRKNMQLIDTNVILRFILNDNEEMAAAQWKLFCPVRIQNRKSSLK